MDAARYFAPVHRGVHQLAAHRALGRSTRPRLLVVAPAAVEVVRFAGGWLCDRAMAGWDVTVLLAEDTDPRPLTILGARTVALDAVLCAPGPMPRPRALAVHRGLHDADPRVRLLVRDALDSGLAEVELWGAGGTTSLRGGAEQARPRPSAAAQAFNARALAAVGQP